MKKGKTKILKDNKNESVSQLKYPLEFKSFHYKSSLPAQQRTLKRKTVYKHLHLTIQSRIHKPE